MKKYIFRKYSRKYSKLYKIERNKLLKILPRNAEIEHIGSTAVPGLGGKGILDLIVGVNKSKLLLTRDKLIDAGYIFKDKAGGKNRLFFEKDYVHRKKTRRVHIQLTIKLSKVWREAITFRNFLKENLKLAKEYELVKKKAVRHARGKGELYRKYKHKFIQNILRKAE